MRNIVFAVLARFLVTYTSAKWVNKRWELLYMHGIPEQTTKCIDYRCPFLIKINLFFQFPQQPLLELEAYKKYEMDEYPLGTNACVAVISYTGSFFLNIHLLSV